MAHWLWAVVVATSLLLGFSLEANAAQFGTPFGEPEAAKGQQQSDQSSRKPQTETRKAAPTTGVGAVPIAENKSYRIGPLDILEISVFGVPELSGTVEVGENGNVQLPLVGETLAAGKTTEELRKDLTSKLATEYLQNPQVRVTVTEFKSSTVILTGDINSPGVYPLKGETTLLQIVATAGGFKESSDSTVLVLRKASGGKRLAAKFDVDQIAQGRAQDPVLRSGDTIVAGRSAMKAAYQMFLKALPIAGVFALF
jgi:polysaccharide biosynthesis/export protein